MNGEVQKRGVDRKEEVKSCAIRNQYETSLPLDHQVKSPHFTLSDWALL